MESNDPSKPVRVIREPGVYLVGRQVVAEETLDTFLRDHGVAWQTDTEVAAEHLTETAGRVCYMSFAKPGPAATGPPRILEAGRFGARTRCGVSSSPE